VLPSLTPLAALLDECRQLVGLERQAEIEALARALRPNPGLDEYQGPPYPELEPFTEHQAAVFFGRACELRDLVRALADQQFVCVIGDSGSGKSSVVSASLIPALRNDAIAGSREWLVTRRVPGKVRYPCPTGPSPSILCWSGSDTGPIPSRAC
jgi:hypothetical protein